MIQSRFWWFQPNPSRYGNGAHIYGIFPNKASLLTLNPTDFVSHRENILQRVFARMTRFSDPTSPGIISRFNQQPESQARRMVNTPIGPLWKIT